MSSFELNVDPREAQYARFAGAVLATLRSAVQRRRDTGLSQREIADRIGMESSSLSRVLNGRIKNLTIRTISDILWATEHEPNEFSADALEHISRNYCPIHLRNESMPIPAANKSLIFSVQAEPRLDKETKFKVLRLEPTVG